MDEITSADYLNYCKRRFGTSNPERMNIPVWEWMVRKQHSPYSARQRLALEHHYERPGNPDWCFERMGAAQVEMDDGRIITIAGEYEDYYDPDFCIYNDVVVQHGDRVEIYGYPRAVFPPTDFHTATRVEAAIYIIGSLGYSDERGSSVTPVFRLDTQNYGIEPVATDGDSPGWIHDHRAVYLPKTDAIEITGGQCIVSKMDDEYFRDNFDVFRLSLRDGSWRRLTDYSSWRQFSLEYDIRTAPVGDLAWFTGEVLKELGYPCQLYDDEAENEDGGARTTDRIHTLTVDDAPVLCSDRLGEIRIVIQGRLEQSTVDTLIADLKKLAKRTGRPITRVIEL